MQCPTCGAAQLIHDTRDLEFSHQGVTITVPAVTGDFCPVCGEHLLGPEESRRTMDLMLALHEPVHQGLMDSQWIAGVRKKLNLDQREAGAIFGGGVNAFSRYENGKETPPRSLIKLLKLLERHPDLFEEVKSD